MVARRRGKTREISGKQAYVRRASAGLTNTAFYRCLFDQLQINSGIWGLTQV